MSIPRAGNTMQRTAAYLYWVASGEMAAPPKRVVALRAM
ncbi:hypothetical protein PI126_g11145 [Phytophthora idaei]|nr:hypothetical protein PI126_g11145 [Phytophthora idaei]